MRISYNSYRTHKFFRYCLNCTLLSSSTPKTLNPKTPDNVLQSNSLCTDSALWHSLFGSSLFCSSALYQLQKQPFLSDFSSGSASNCNLNSYLVLRNRFLGNSSGWSSSRWKFESHSRYKKHSIFSYSSKIPSGICSLRHSFLQYLGSLTILKQNSRNLSSNSVYASSSRTFICGPDLKGAVQNVANVCSDQQKLEKRNHFPRKFVLEIIDIIKNDDRDLESKLSIEASRLTVYSVTEIFEFLNYQRVSGLRFFEWILTNIPQLHKNAHVCSLIIDNLGRMDDYETMFTLLEEFRSKKICLSYEAFGFLTVLASNTSLLEEATKRVVDLLNTVGGSFRDSSVCALIEMFSKLDLFDMARYVIKITERKESYYCLLLREKCNRGFIEDARGIIRDMREAQCGPNTKVYNYLLGSLCKNGLIDEASKLLDEIKENGILPDAITYEILINYLCSLGNLNTVHQLLGQMMSQGIEPRLLTHASIVKSLFGAEKYEEAHDYVIKSNIIYKASNNELYSLMANLYREKGDITSAGHILAEMMDKNLKPNFSIYVKIVKQFRRNGWSDLAMDLEDRHSKFVTKSQR